MRIFRCCIFHVESDDHLSTTCAVVFILALSLGSTASATRLTVKRPSGRLLSTYNLVLMGGFIALTVAWQV